ncbi:methyltransferase domain protein [Ceratobasidium sp. AG-Ba]|nr:methyltransferase domain protein [Ceratobasidium sp. AG-Ba]
MPVYTYYDADTDGVVYHVVPDPEDEDDNMSTLESQTETIDSYTTIQSNELPEQEMDMIPEGYFVIHHGRQQPAIDNIAKFYPTDNLRRYILRYLVNKSVLGGDYLGPVRDILAPIRERQRHVLELGTKTGTWIQSMAIQFPYVQFRSVDVVPMMPHVQRPNITFEVYNYTEGLRLEDDSQDAVFINNVVEMVQNYRALLREAHRVLRPGGVIHIIESLLLLWEAENPSQPAHRTNPASFRLGEIAREQLSIMGIDPDTPRKLSDWLAPSSDIWKDVNRANVGFEQIESVMRSHPIYPHEGFPCASWFEARMNPFIRQMSIITAKDFFGILRDRGIEKEEAEKMIERSIEELPQPERI